MASDPENALVLFGLAKEYEKAGRHRDVVETLAKYLEKFDDEGNAYGMLAVAHEKLGDREAARAAYRRGIEVASAHGHPSMAEEYRTTLAAEDDD